MFAAVPHHAVFTGRRWPKKHRKSHSHRVFGPQRVTNSRGPDVRVLRLTVDRRFVWKGGCVHKVHHSLGGLKRNEVHHSAPKHVWIAKVPHILIAATRELKRTVTTSTTPTATATPTSTPIGPIAKQPPGPPSPATTDQYQYVDSIRLSPATLVSIKDRKNVRFTKSADQLFVTRTPSPS